MIIIKYFEWMKLIKDERHPVYEICDKHYKCRKKISREEAMWLIKDNNLRLAFFSNDGAIWEP
jgi:hypothetical protein